MTAVSAERSTRLTTDSLLQIAARPASGKTSFEASVLTGDLVFTSGQLPLVDGELVAQGLVGRDVDTSTAALAARFCTAHALNAVMAQAGGRSIERVVKMVGYVASAPGFHDQAAVMNDASAFLHEVLDDGGGHARSAIGVAALPRGAAVEVELVVQLSPAIHTEPELQAT